MRNRKPSAGSRARFPLPTTSRHLPPLSNTEHPLGRIEGRQAHGSPAGAGWVWRRGRSSRFPGDPLASPGVRARVIRSHSEPACPSTFLSSGLDKGPIGGYLSPVESKPPSAVAGIGRAMECRGEPLVERDLHLKVERRARCDYPAPVQLVVIVVTASCSTSPPRTAGARAASTPARMAPRMYNLRREGTKTSSTRGRERASGPHFRRGLSHPSATERALGLIVSDCGPSSPACSSRVPDCARCSNRRPATESSKWARGPVTMPFAPPAGSRRAARWRYWTFSSRCCRFSSLASKGWGRPDWTRPSALRRTSPGGSGKCRVWPPRRLQDFGVGPGCRGA